MSLTCGFRRYGRTKITNAYRTMKYVLLQRLTFPIAMGRSQCLSTSSYTSIFAVSNDTSFVSVEGRVQKIQSHKFTHVHQNHEKWFISRAHSSISDGNVIILLHTLINFNLCCIQQFQSLLLCKPYQDMANCQRRTHDICH